MVRRGSRATGSAPAKNTSSALSSSGSTHNETQWKNLRPQTATGADTNLSKNTKSSDSANSSPGSRKSVSFLQNTKILLNEVDNGKQFIYRQVRQSQKKASHNPEKGDDRAVTGELLAGMGVMSQLIRNSRSPARTFLHFPAFVEGTEELAILRHPRI